MRFHPAAALTLAGLLAGARGVQNVLWLPLGDSITFGCTGPTIQELVQIRQKESVSAARECELTNLRTPATTSRAAQLPRLRRRLPRAARLRAHAARAGRPV